MIFLHRLALVALFFCVRDMTAMNYELLCLNETDLACNIASQLDKKLHTPILQQFADGELNVVLPDPAIFANKTAIIIQSTSDPVNQNVLGIAFCAHELKNAGASRVIAVIPYFGYSRQERSTIPGKPGHAAVIAALFQGAGIDEIIAVELHDDVLKRLFTIPVHNILVNDIISEHIQETIAMQQAPCLIAPDQGAAEYVHDVADRLDLGMLVFSKKRYAKDQTRVTDLAGECRSTVGIIIDDILSTGGTAVNACSQLNAQGFSTMYGYFVHPVFAGNAVRRIEESNFAKIYVSNTIPLSPQAQESKRIVQFDVSRAIVAALHKEIV